MWELHNLELHLKALRMAAMFLVLAFLKFYVIQGQSKHFSPAVCPITFAKSNRYSELCNYEKTSSEENSVLSQWEDYKLNLERNIILLK